MMYTYLSFADDTGFLGACVVEGDTIEDAVANAWKHGCNPGGEVMAFPHMPNGKDRWPKNQLLSIADIQAIPGEGGMKLGEAIENGIVPEAWLDTPCSCCGKLLPPGGHG